MVSVLRATDRKSEHIEKCTNTLLFWVESKCPDFTALADSQTLRMHSREVCECWGLSKPAIRAVHKGPQADFLPTSRDSAWDADFTRLHWFNYLKVFAIWTWRCSFSNCRLKIQKELVMSVWNNYFIKTLPESRRPEIIFNHIMIQKYVEVLATEEIKMHSIVVVFKCW